MRIALYQVDAFTDSVFAGNPAAVCPLGAWLDDDMLQAIAAENNLSETAFFVPEGEGFRLRWFTPTTEVDLCGHATLAAAHVIFEHLRPQRDSIELESRIQFESKSGPLVVTRDGGRIRLDFPAIPAEPAEPPSGLVEALGATPTELLRAKKLLAVFESEDDVRGIAPDFEALKRTAPYGIVISAPGKTHDFVSRFFHPAICIPEDPVTGAAHCVLTPYWAKRIGKTTLHARQISERGGDVWCELHGDRVHLSGHTVLYLRGEIDVS